MTSTSVDAAQDELENLALKSMEAAHVPGAAVGILDRGERRGWGFGIANLETRQSVTPDTLFHIGSISKVFTATLVMTLVDEGRVDLDEPVQRYVPDLRLGDDEALRALTVRHLLTHTGGFEGDRFLNPDFGMDTDALGRCIGRFHTLSQIAPPGELWSYCNTGLFLASHLAATMSNMPFEDAMRERVFWPLGMERSTLYVHEAIAYPVANGHQVTADGPAPERTYMIPRHVAGAGRVISTVNELLLFAAFHMGDGTVGGTRVLTEASLRQMQEPQVWLNSRQAWGLGWGIRVSSGTKIIEHGGGGYGMIANLALAPDDGFAIAVLTNSTSGAAVTGPVTDWALKRYRGVEPPQLALEPLSKNELSRYAGTFEMPLMRLTLEAHDEGLVLHTRVADELKIFGSSDSTLTLGHVGHGEFAGTHEGSIVTPVLAEFIEAPDGTVRFVRFAGRLAVPVETEAV